MASRLETYPKYTLMDRKFNVTTRPFVINVRKQNNILINSLSQLVRVLIVLGLITNEVALNLNTVDYND